MNISELKANETFDSLIARILSRNGPKPVTVNGQKRYCWEMLLRDPTGTVILTLWGAHTGEAYRLNSIVEIRNGEVKMWRDQYQISLGSEGTIQQLPDNPAIPRTIG